VSDSLSIIIPVYNGEEWIAQTIEHLERAVAKAGLEHAEFVIVDDGSSDRTSSVVEALHTGLPLTFIKQPNQGRFLARLHGLEAAKGETALLIDLRVFIDEDALAFVFEEMGRDPAKLVWNGHPRTASSAKPWTRFWNPITFIAWRRYLGNPRLTSFGVDDFDHFPKGTGLFIAPVAELLELCEQFDSNYDDISKASDDTLLIKPLAERHRINIAPQFGAVYFPRDSFADFLRHSYFRGTTFVDGHLRPGQRFNRLFWTASGAGLVLAVFGMRRPRLAAKATVVSVGVLPVGLASAGVAPGDAASFTALLPAFGVTYGAGIIRGLFMRSRAKRRATA
jgi:glycosyltransferase involved in cell wall biosynthesis